MNVIHTGPFGVNTYIVPLCGNNVFVVDPACCSFCDDEDVITDFLSQNNLNLVAIVLTHGHFDHVAGLSILKKSYPEVPVLIHEEDSRMIGADSRLLQEKDLMMMGFFDFVPSVSNLPQADGFLKDGFTICDCHSFGLSQEIETALSEWKVIHTPGHTKGCCCLYNKKSGILITGDTMFYHSWGRTDLTGGDEVQIRKSLLKIVELADEADLVYPGHDKFGFKLQENL